MMYENDETRVKVEIYIQLIKENDNLFFGSFSHPKKKIEYMSKKIVPREMCTLGFFFVVRKVEQTQSWI